MTPLPQTEQVRLAQKITSQKTSLAAARRIIYRETMHHAEVTKRSPTDHLASLIALCNQTSERFGIFVDMLPEARNAMIDIKNDHGKKVLAEMLEDLADNISGIAEDVRKRIVHQQQGRSEPTYSNR